MNYDNNFVIFQCKATKVRVEIIFTEDNHTVGLAKGKTHRAYSFARAIRSGLKDHGLVIKALAKADSMSRDELIDCIGPKAEAYRIDTAETYGFDESEFAFSESITPNFLQSSTGTTPKPTKPKASKAKPKASKPKAKATPSKMVEGRRVGPKTDARSELLVEKLIDSTQGRFKVSYQGSSWWCWEVQIEEGTCTLTRSHKADPHGPMGHTVSVWEVR